MANDYDYNGSYRLGVGTIALASFDESYEVRKFPRQDDQPDIVDWLDPLDGSDVYSDVIETVRAMNGAAGTWGNGFFTWYLGYLSPLMVKYLFDTFWPDGAGSCDVTVMTFDAGYGFRTVWAKALRPNLAEAERVGYGYNRVKIEFTEAVEAA